MKHSSLIIIGWYLKVKDMPIEVRELVIKATVVQDDTGSGSSTSSGKNITPNEQIINACVEKILEILRDRDER